MPGYHPPCDEFPCGKDLALKSDKQNSRKPTRRFLLRSKTYAHDCAPRNTQTPPNLLSQMKFHVITEPMISKSQRKGRRAALKCNRVWLRIPYGFSLAIRMCSHPTDLQLFTHRCDHLELLTRWVTVGVTRTMSPKSRSFLLLAQIEEICLHAVVERRTTVGLCGARSQFRNGFCTVKRLCQ